MIRIPRRPCQVAFSVLLALLTGASACKKRPPTASKIMAPTPATVTLKIGEGDSLKAPRALALDPSGALYVADVGNFRVVKYTPEGKQLLTFGAKGSGEGQFESISSLAATDKGEVLVLDRTTPWIQVFSKDGKFVRRFGGPELALYGPMGLAVGKDGTLYIADTGGSRIVVLNPDGSKKREPLKTMGSESFNQPSDVAIEESGRVVVYQPFDGTAKSGKMFFFTSELTLERSFSSLQGPSTWDTPRYVASKGGLVYQTDPQNQRVLLLKGEEASPVQLTGPFATTLRLPAGIAVDGKNRVYVSDANTNLVYRFEHGTPKFEEPKSGSEKPSPTPTPEA